MVAVTVRHLGVNKDDVSSLNFKQPCLQIWHGKIQHWKKPKQRIHCYTCESISPKNWPVNIIKVDDYCGHRAKDCILCLMVLIYIFIHLADNDQYWVIGRAPPSDCLPIERWLSSFTSAAVRVKQPSV